jgi:hypothetical protein
LNKTSAQLQAKHVMVATLLHTPAIDIRAEAIAGLDASFLNFFDGGIPSFDGGFTLPDGGAIPFDAGLLPFDLFDAGILIPPQTGVFTFFGTRNGEGLMQSAPTPISGTTMTMTLEGGSEYALKDLGQGTFQLTTQDDTTLNYEPGANYRFTAKADNQTFIAIAAEVPQQETIPQFHPEGRSYISIDAGSDFTFRRPDAPSGSERDLAFVIVIPIDREGKQAEPTYTDVPQQALDILTLVVAPSKFKKTLVTIPGRAFPERDRNYIILVQSAKLGRADTDNLFAGSAIIGGSADIGIVKTY